MRKKIKQLDENILLYLQNNIRTKKKNNFFTTITRLGDRGFIWILISLVLLSRKKSRKTGGICLLAITLSVIVNEGILKHLCRRRRPFKKIESLETLVKQPKDYSFPSGHTASSFATAGLLYRFMPKIAGIPAVLLADLIGVSRMYIGVHYPTDVFFGMLCGLGISGLSIKTWELGEKLWKRKTCPQF